MGLTGARGSTSAGRRRRKRVLDRADHRCHYCGAPATIADHYLPKSAGGSDSEENLVAACQPCNSAKSDTLPDVFLASDWLAERRREVAGAKR